jgi:hypothetical protein
LQEEFKERSTKCNQASSLIDLPPYGAEPEEDFIDYVGTPEGEEEEAEDEQSELTIPLPESIPGTLPIESSRLPDETIIEYNTHMNLNTSVANSLGRIANVIKKVAPEVSSQLEEEVDNMVNQNSTTHQ